MPIDSKYYLIAIILCESPFLWVYFIALLVT